MKKKYFGLVLFFAILGVSITCMANLSKNVSMSDASGKTFVKTKNKCSKCSCSGYWGYKHQNGTYEGNCSNTDKYGHKCEHGPEKHGLRKW